METERDDEIRIVGIVSDEVGLPRNDGSPGSSLYAVPFRLTRAPSPQWIRFFLRAWDLPPRFTSMHRPGIAKVIGDRVILDGTTIEEVEKYHLDTLKLAVTLANKLEREEKATLRQRASAEEQKQERHRKHVEEIAKRLKFDN